MSCSMKRQLLIFYQNIHVNFPKLQKFEIKYPPYMFTKLFNALQNYCDHGISHLKLFKIFFNNIYKYYSFDLKIKDRNKNTVYV